MRFEPRLDPPAGRRPLARRLAWMAAIWGMSVALLGGLSFVIGLFFR